MTDLLLIDVKEFSSLFGISMRTEFQWRQGIPRIPYINLNGRIYYRVSDILKALEELTVSNVPDKPLNPSNISNLKT